MRSSCWFLERARAARGDTSLAVDAVVRPAVVEPNLADGPAVREASGATRR